MMKKFLITILGLLALLFIYSVAYAQPNYKVVTTNASYTAVDIDDGLLAGVYVVRGSTSAAGTVSIRATDTAVVIVPDIVIVGDANAGKVTNPSIEPIFVPEVPVKYTAGLKVQTGSIDLDVLILYYPRIKE